MNPDEQPWIEVARKVLAGHYLKTARKGSSLRTSLLIGLRSIKHPDCQKAVEMLRETR